jgi:tryptophanyl-tRNA synthetase
LTLAHSFKDKADRLEDVNAGLFSYPMLMAADILLYDAQFVPVGKDQLQHLEITRDVASRFNHQMGETFVIPEGVILKETAKIYDLQNPEAKMSKSGDPKGLVNIMDDSDSIMKKIKTAVTDTDGVIKFDREAKPGVSNLLGIHSAISGQSIDALVSHFDGKGYGDLKTEVAEVVLSVVEPIRSRANELLADPAELDRILTKGANKAQEVAEVTLATVYERVGFIAPAR